MYKSVFKHGLDPPATGFLKSTLSGSRNYCIKRGIGERPFNIQEGAQGNLSYDSRNFPAYEQPGRELFQ